MFERNGNKPGVIATWLYALNMRGSAWTINTVGSLVYDKKTRDEMVRKVHEELTTDFIKDNRVEDINSKK
jgi:hypothetical protein